LSFVGSVRLVDGPARPSERPGTGAPALSLTSTASDPWSAPNARARGVTIVSSTAGRRERISGCVTLVRTLR
jgi:hypothetical protein